MNSYQIKNNVSYKKIGSILLRKFVAGSTFLLLSNQIFAAELLIPVIGSTASSTASGYVSGFAGYAYSFLRENPKTFDNLFNEAVCGISRDKIRVLTENTLREIQKQALPFASSAYAQSSIDFQNSASEVLLELGESALRHSQRYELALLTLDLIDQTKTQINEAIQMFDESLKLPYDARVLGADRAKQLQSTRSDRIDKATKVLTGWKMNIMAGLYQKYPYVCEGGFKDKYERSTIRHRERGKYWGIDADWLGYVSIPKMNLSIEIPFSEADRSEEAGTVFANRPIYECIFDVLQSEIKGQIGSNNVDYLFGLREQFSALFPGKNPTLPQIDKPDILVKYEAYLADQRALARPDEQEDDRD